MDTTHGKELSQGGTQEYPCPSWNVKFSVNFTANDEPPVEDTPTEDDTPTEIETKDDIPPPRPPERPPSPKPAQAEVTLNADEHEEKTKPNDITEIGTKAEQNNVSEVKKKQQLMSWKFANAGHKDRH